MNLKEHHAAGLPAYAIGIERKPGSFGMTDGPSRTVMEMLDAPGCEGACIIRLGADGSDKVIFRWQDGEWHPSPGG